MKSLFHSGNILTKRFISTALVGLFVCLASPTRASDQSGFQVNPNAEAGDVIVRGKLGGLIFGFEVDPMARKVCSARRSQTPTAPCRPELRLSARLRVES